MNQIETKQTIEITNDFTDFEAVRWVTGAINPKDSKVIRFLLAEDERIVGTDGQRLHIAVCALPPGFYEIVRRTQKVIELHRVESDDRYPDFDSCFPKTKPTAVVDLIKTHNHTTTHDYTRVIRKMNESVTLDYQYFQDANQNMDKASIFEPLNGVLLENHHLKALIMPWKMN